MMHLLFMLAAFMLSAVSGSAAPKRAPRARSAKVSPIRPTTIPVGTDITATVPESTLDAAHNSVLLATVTVLTAGSKADHSTAELAKELLLARRGFLVSVADDLKNSPWRTELLEAGITHVPDVSGVSGAYESWLKGINGEADRLAQEELQAQGYTREFAVSLVSTARTNLKSAVSFQVRKLVEVQLTKEQLAAYGYRPEKKLGAQKLSEDLLVAWGTITRKPRAEKTAELQRVGVRAVDTARKAGGWHAVLEMMVGALDHMAGLAEAGERPASPRGSYLKLSQAVLDLKKVWAPNLGEAEAPAPTVVPEPATVSTETIATPARKPRASKAAAK